MGKWRRNKSLTKRWQKDHLIKKHGAVCYLCGIQFESKKDITLDHVLPVSKGGFDELSNYGLAHYECNQMKNDMTIEEFREFQQGGKYVE